MISGVDSMMKMIMAIVNKEDSRHTVTALTAEGFSVTRLATTGGFLMDANVTLLIGVEEEKVDAVLAIIEKTCKKRKQVVSNNFYGTSYPVEVNVGGATVFVMPVERFERL